MPTFALVKKAKYSCACALDQIFGYEFGYLKSTKASGSVHACPPRSAQTLAACGKHFAVGHVSPAASLAIRKTALSITKVIVTSAKRHVSVDVSKRILELLVVCEGSSRGILSDSFSAHAFSAQLYSFRSHLKCTQYPA
jgi:hypothetical protein